MQQHCRTHPAELTGQALLAVDVRARLLSCFLHCAFDSRRTPPVGTNRPLLALSLATTLRRYGVVLLDEFEKLRACAMEGLLEAWDTGKWVNKHLDR